MREIERAKVRQSLADFTERQLERENRRKERQREWNAGKLPGYRPRAWESGRMVELAGAGRRETR